MGKLYIGVSNKARKVKKLYIGVNGVARKVKKAYIGVGGKARLFYSAATETAFTSSVFPTSWTSGGTSADASHTASDTYGNWTCSVNTKAYSSTYAGWKAFDGSTSTYYRPSASSGTTYDITATINLPANISIKPSQITIRVSQIKANSTFEGKNEETGNWETLFTYTSAVGSVTNITNTSSTTKFFTAFRFNFSHLYKTNYMGLNEISIPQGTLKDAR